MHASKEMFFSLGQLIFPQVLMLSKSIPYLLYGNMRPSLRPVHLHK